MSTTGQPERATQNRVTTLFHDELGYRRFPNTLPSPWCDRKMDAKLTALEQRRDKTRALKQGMMQELLTGRTRLVDKPRSHE